MRKWEKRQKLDDRRQKAEDRRQRAEIGNGNLEGGIRKWECGRWKIDSLLARSSDLFNALNIAVGTKAGSA
jgi:hypothetical protein